MTQVRISGRDEVWKTKVLKKNLNPQVKRTARLMERSGGSMAHPLEPLVILQWQETFEIPGVSLNDTLLLQVFDHDAGLVRARPCVPSWPWC